MNVQGAMMTGIYVLSCREASDIAMVLHTQWPFGETYQLHQTDQNAPKSLEHQSELETVADVR
jgi:hypothetical protein